MKKGNMIENGMKVIWPLYGVAYAHGVHILLTGSDFVLLYLRRSANTKIISIPWHLNHVEQ